MLLKDVSNVTEGISDQISHLNPLEASYLFIKEMSNPTIHAQDVHIRFMDQLRRAIEASAQYNWDLEKPRIVIWYRRKVQKDEITEEEAEVSCVAESMLSKLVYVPPQPIDLLGDLTGH